MSDTITGSQNSDTRHITKANLRTHPGLVTTILPYDGQTVTLRLTTPDDSRILGDYFLGLSQETKRRYGPHPFDRATAEQLCANTDPATVTRWIATVQADSGARVIGYIILILGIREDDAARYAKLNIPLVAETDCTLAPSVADSYQGKGLGSLLMNHLKDVARWLDYRRMVLWGGTQATNDRAIHFYQKHGFQKVGEFQEPPGFNNYDMIMSL